MSDMFEPVIGLEIHFQLNTKTKLFCRCKSEHDAVPNTNVCPVCLGLPGALPSLNMEAIKKGIAIIKILNGKIHHHSRFYRKNYFYPDLPKGYQITQYEASLGTDGYVDIETSGIKRRIRIERMNIEEEAARSIHVKTGDVLLDYNRSGIPLLEVTTYPDIRSPEEARLFLEKLRNMVSYIGASGCDMEKGEMRVDANISVRRKGDKEYGVRVELKNLNSIRAVEDGLEVEFKRHIDCIQKGIPIEMETRLFDEFKKETRSMRKKEASHDYRFFPEPDLPELVLTSDFIKEVESNLPEMPEERERRYRKMGISESDILTIMRDRHLADYFDHVVSVFNRPHDVAKVLINELSGIVRKTDYDFEHLPLKPEEFGRLLNLKSEGKINRNQMILIIKRYLEGKGKLSQLIDAFSKDEVEFVLEDVIKEVLSEGQDLVQKYRSGKKGVLGALIGLVMKKTKGRANPKEVKALLERYLEDG